MKRRIASGVVAILLVLAVHGAVCAQEEVKAVAGLKTWINNWKKQTPGVESTTSTTATLVGWMAEAEFSNRVFVGISYLMTFYDYYFYQPAGRLEMDRNDIDVIIGYRFNSHVDVYTGYRSTRLLDEDTKAKETLSGPLLAIRGSVPLGKNFSLFGGLTYLPWMNKATYAAFNEREDAFEWFAEAGVRYAFTRKIVGAIGYKHETAKGKHSEVVDTFAGVTFDATYFFY